MRAAQLDENNVVINFAEVGGFDGVEFVDPLDSVIGSIWSGQSFTAPAPIPPTRDDLKAQRQAAVNAITVIVNGKVFDGDETSQERMARALRVSDITGQTSCTWVLHDNTPVMVTRDELAQALSLSMQAQANLWVIPVS
jgi:hypothetical protein